MTKPELLTLLAQKVEALEQAVLDADTDPRIRKLADQLADEVNELTRLLEAHENL